MPSACRRRWPEQGSSTPTTRSWRRQRSSATCSTPRTTGSASGKRSRSELAPAYRERYLQEILDHVDLDGVIAKLPDVSALFCIEHDPEACHRSLVADRLAEAYGVKIVHLR